MVTLSENDADSGSQCIGGVLDEPTNHLDAFSREELENTLLDYDGTMLIVSHDRYFINKLSSRILELNENGFTEYLGNYDYYIEKKAARHPAAVNTDTAKKVEKVNDYKLKKEAQDSVDKNRK